MAWTDPTSGAAKVWLADSYDGVVFGSYPGSDGHRRSTYTRTDYHNGWLQFSLYLLAGGKI